MKAGKVRAIGASNYSAERLAEALDISEREGLARYEVLQPEYNLMTRDKFEGALQQLCIERGLGVLPYYGLASGFLTGKYRSAADKGKSVRGGRMDAYLERARPRHPRRARRGRRRSRRHARPGRFGLARRPARRHRPDRQRDQRSSSSRSCSACLPWSSVPSSSKG